jgi:hypothetical protein
MGRVCGTNAVTVKCIQNFAHKNMKREDLVDVRVILKWIL